VVLQMALSLRKDGISKQDESALGTNPERKIFEQCHPFATLLGQKGQEEKMVQLHSADHD